MLRRRTTPGVLLPFQHCTLTFQAVGTFHHSCLFHDMLGMLGTIDVKPRE